MSIKNEDMMQINCLLHNTSDIIEILKGEEFARQNMCEDKTDVKGEDKLDTCLKLRTLKGLTFFGILQGSYRNIKKYYFILVSYMKIQFGDGSRHNKYGEPENVNYESIINEFVTKKN